MDLLDRKILYELDKNSRISFVKLAKTLKISPERLRYRVESLKNNGVIKHFLTTMNLAFLGYSVFELFVKFQNINQSIKDDMIGDLSKSSKVAWIGDLEGNFDLGIIFVAKSQMDLHELILEFNKKYAKYIMKKSLSVNLKGDFFKRDYLLFANRKELRLNSNKKDSKILRLDDSDAMICKMIAKDSRITAVDMANSLKVSVDTVIKRLRNLEHNVITSYTIVLDNTKLNQIHYKLLIYLNNRFDEDKLISYIKMNSRVITIVKTLAEWDYEIDLEVSDVNQIKDFTMNLTRIYSQNIRDYSILHVVDMPKYTFYP
jgi:DNA-binding Lrp family transcriptional regulator